MKKAGLIVLGLGAALLGTAGYLRLAGANLDLESPEIGKPAPDFTLPASNGKAVTLSGQRKKFVVLEWLNHGCPFVRKHYGTGNMQALQREYTAKGVVWLSIVSSAPGKQGHCTPEEAEKEIRENQAHPTAVLLDPEGRVGRLYGAKTTPHMFVVDPKGALIYQGAIDDKPSTRRSTVKTAKSYLRAALEAALEGKPVPEAVTKPYGCSVKYARN